VKGSYGSLKASEGLLKDALALDPGFLDAKTLLAHVLADQWQTGLADQSGGLDSSIRLLEQVLAARPDDVRATGLLYRTEIWRDVLANNIATAKDTIALLVNFARSHPTDVETVLAAATMAGRFGGDTELATSLIEGVIEFDPLNPAVHYELAIAYHEDERYEEARAAAGRSLELEPHQPNVHTLIARTYRQEGSILDWLRNYIDAITIDPKDHELPGEVAEVLYDLELPEEADRYRDRVLAIAPTSPAAYLVEILHRAAHGDLDGARSAARRAIEDDIDNRQEAFEGAVRFLVRDALANGTAEETLQYLESAIPSLADFDAPVPDIKQQIARYAMLPLWESTLPEDEWKRRYRVMFDYGRQFGFDDSEDSIPSVIIRFINGNQEEATAMWARLLATEPVGTQLTWDLMVRQPVFAAMADDPRIREGLDKYAKDEAALRDSVLAFLRARDQGSSR
jgi:tetratricopeptide (TPR) repeat protein